MTLEQLSDKNRKELRNKMAEVFKEKIKNLPVELQYILLDDLVTAFERRLSLFSQGKPVRSSADFEFAIESDEIVVKA